MNIFMAASSATMDSSTIGGHGTFHYLLIMALMMTGIYLILSRSNMIKSIIGLNLFQVAVIMFYVSMGRVEHGTAPIFMGEDVPHDDGHHDEGHHDAGDEKMNKELAPAVHAPAPPILDAKSTHDIRPLSKRTKKQATIGPTTSKASKIVYSNPLPHVLMLTAIVVGVATTALALSLVVRINEHYGTIEEDELEKKGVLI
jgi:multicomponent Na+:H+ antiporter subunit C